MQGSKKDSGSAEHHPSSEPAAARENDEFIGENDIESQCLVSFAVLLKIQYLSILQKLHILGLPLPSR